MADPKVLEAQRWVNSTYGSVPGYERCAETGVTGWAVMFSLTRALQHELGITALSDSFGPTTLAKLAERGDVSPGYTKPNIVRIAKYGLFCKGYSAGDTSNGGYDNGLYEAVRDLKSNIGFTSDGYIQPKIFKAILNMDAYVLLSGGRVEVRDVQRWLNATYITKSTFFVIPCDGHFTRDVQIALIGPSSTRSASRRTRPPATSDRAPRTACATTPCGPVPRRPGCGCSAPRACSTAASAACSPRSPPAGTRRWATS